MSEDKPYVRADVLYATDGRNGLHYDLPAKVTVTQASHPGDYPCPACLGWGEEFTGVEHAGQREMMPCEECDGSGEGKRNPLPVPSSPTHVHLTVFTPGGVGVRLAQGIEPGSDEDFVGAPGLDLQYATGTYVEHDVPFDPEGSPRSWRWR